MITQKMLEAAMVEAVKRGMFAKDAPADQYITAWEDMRAVLVAAQQCTQLDSACTCGKHLIGSIPDDEPCPVPWHNPPP